MELVDLFVGDVKSPEQYREIIPLWPEKEHSSSYLKEAVSEVEVDGTGLVGNAIGFPTHIANATFRTALVQNMLIWEEIERVIPGSLKQMRAGVFGENFLVNHPDLLPAVVCLGDEYQIGTAVFCVSGPRMPCPKVDAVLGVQGVSALGRVTGWTGYFLKVVAPGICRKGDSITLMKRPYPGMTIERVAGGLWGKHPDSSVEFLQTLADMPFLIPRHFRETAITRLERLKEEGVAAS